MQTMTAADMINITSPRTPIQPGDYAPMQDGEYLTAEERLDSVELYLGQDACTGSLVPLHEELSGLQKRIADHDNDLKELKADKCECLQDVHQAAVNEICDVQTKTRLHDEKISRIFEHINRLDTKLTFTYDQWQVANLKMNGTPADGPQAWEEKASRKEVNEMKEALRAATVANQRLVERIEVLEQEAKRRKLE